MTADVWVATVPPEGGALTLLPRLSDDERARAGRLLHDPSRDAYITAHVLVRDALAARASVPPDAWTFTTEANGRPRIAAPAACTAYTFSLSHCAGLAACAIADGIDVGIDAEPIDRRVRAEGFERYFTPRERATIDRAAPAERGREFLRCWTLKEAYVKALGVGISSSALGNVGFETDPNGTVRAHFTIGAGDAEAWTFRSWQHDGFILACAIRARVAGTIEFVDHVAQLLAGR